MQIKLTTSDKKTIDTTLEEILKKNKKSILYFYPKDNTS
jgi:peroxiredoxin